MLTIDYKCEHVLLLQHECEHNLRSPAISSSRQVRGGSATLSRRRHFFVSSFPFPISYFLVPPFRATPRSGGSREKCLGGPLNARARFKEIAN